MQTVGVTSTRILLTVAAMGESIIDVAMNYEREGPSLFSGPNVLPYAVPLYAVFCRWNDFVVRTGLTSATTTLFGVDYGKLSPCA